MEREKHDAVGIVHRYETIRGNWDFLMKHALTLKDKGWDEMKPTL